jgi:glycolate oxidase
MGDSRGGDVKQRFATTQELVVAARQRLDDNVWDFLTGGTESEATLARNRQALDELALRPRVLRDVRKVDPSVELLGCRLRLPLFIAPLGGLTMFDPEGTVAVARAAPTRDTLVFQSSTSLPEIEQGAAAANGRLIYQLYVRGERDWVTAQTERAVACGSRALCITVDSAAYSRRERDMISRFTGGGGSHRVMTSAGREHQAAFNWGDIAFLRKRFPALPVIIKGITTAEDAGLAVEHGVAAVYVSNHGGRQLDHGQGAIEILPEVVDAVRGRAEIVVDGGFVRGTDVLKAVALGATAVGIGKLTGWSLAAAGTAGVERMLDILEEEIVKDMMLLGITRLAELEKSFVCAARATALPSALSAFPRIGADGKWRR